MSTSIQSSQDERNRCGNAPLDRDFGRGEPSFGVSLFGFAIHVEAQSADLVRLFDRSVFPSVPRITLAAPYADLRLRIDQAEGQFRLHRNGEVIGSAACADLLSRGLIDCIDRAFIDQLKNLHAVHAGAVQFGDRALLLPGKSFAGKSSLVAELLRRGATCLSDEYALIDGAGMVHSYPRPLLLRNGGHEQTPILPGELQAQTAAGPARVGWILSLRYEAGGSWNVQGVPQSMALLSLLQNTPHALADSPRMVDSFERAVAGAQCFEGRRGEMADAADRILAMAQARHVG